MSSDRGMGRGLGGDPVRAPTAGEDAADADELRELPVELDRAEPRPAAQALRRGGAAGAGRLARASAASCSRCSCARVPGGTLRARRRRAPLARRAARGARARCPRSSASATTRSRSRSRSSRTWPARTSTRSRRRAPAPRSSRSSASPARRSAAASAAAASRSRTSCACSTCPTRRSRCSRPATLTEGHGRALLLADDHADRRRLARAAAAEGWSVRVARGSAPARPTRPAPRRQARPRARSIPTRRPRPPRSPTRSARALGTEVTVRPRGTGYKVELAFDDVDEALALARRLRRRAGRLKPRYTRATRDGRLAQSVRALL